MPIDRELEKNWDPQLSKDMDDSRLRSREKNRVYRAHMWWERVFCASCAAPGGLVTADWSPHVFFLCDACAQKGGTPPGCVEIDAKTVQGQ